MFVTWRLHGSLPPNRVFPPETTAGRAFAAMDSILDHATSGPLHLRRSEIAILMVDAIRHGEEHTGYYRSHAYVVMANHVHLLITPLATFRRKILDRAKHRADLSWKGSEDRANKSG
jgi:hypothetical protein